MVDTIRKDETLLYQTTYASSIDDTLQQKVSKLKNFCDFRNLQGESFWQATAGVVTVQEGKVFTGSDMTHESMRTPIQHIEFTKRMLTSKPICWGTYVDDLAELRAGIKLGGVYVRNAMASFEQQIDKMIYNAFFKDVQINAQDSSQTSGLDKIKFFKVGSAIDLRSLAKARTHLTAIEQRALYCACDSFFKEGLLYSTEATSRDYSNILALVAGSVEKFLDTTFIQLASNLIPKIAYTLTETNSVMNIPTLTGSKPIYDTKALKAKQVQFFPIFAKDSIILGTLKPLATHIQADPSMRYKTSIYAEQDMGAIRAVDELVGCFVMTPDDMTGINKIKFTAGSAFGNAKEAVINLL